MHLCTKQTDSQTENRLEVAKEEGEGVGWTGNLGLVDAKTTAFGGDKQ